MFQTAFNKFRLNKFEFKLNQNSNLSGGKISCEQAWCWKSEGCSVSAVQNTL